MKVIARLFTACGAVRDMPTDHMTPTWVIPLMPSARYGSFADIDDHRVPEFKSRRFNLERSFHYADGIIAEYREQLVV